MKLSNEEIKEQLDALRNLKNPSSAAAHGVGKKTVNYANPVGLKGSIQTLNIHNAEFVKKASNKLVRVGAAPLLRPALDQAGKEVLNKYSFSKIRASSTSKPPHPQTSSSSSSVELDDNTQPQKKEVCRFFKTGNCNAGEACKFSHVLTNDIKTVREETEEAPPTFCKFFGLGQCNLAEKCPFVHDPLRVMACPQYLATESCKSILPCRLSHDITQFNQPICLYNQQSTCKMMYCRYWHAKKFQPGTPVCRAFAFTGYCDKGYTCNEKHLHVCPDFDLTGSCPREGVCKMRHTPSKAIKT